MRSTPATTHKWGRRMSSLTANLLHVAYAGPNASKRMARDAGTSHRTAEKWWAKLTTPRTDVLIRMAQENEQLRAAMILALQGDAYAGLVDDVDGIARQAGCETGARRRRTVAATDTGSAAGTTPAAVDGGRTHRAGRAATAVGLRGGDRRA